VDLITLELDHLPGSPVRVSTPDLLDKLIARSTEEIKRALRASNGRWRLHRLVKDAPDSKAKA
jgi:hypothetical protein